MKSRCLPLALIVLGFTTSLAAQHGGGGGGAGSGGHPGGGGTSTGGLPTAGSSSTTSVPSSNVPALNPTDTMFFVSGKVVVDDGTMLTDIASLQTNCKGQRRTVGHTDPKGFFSFQLGGTEPETYGDGDITDSVSATPGSSGQPGSGVDWRSCELQALAPGFTSQTLELASRLNNESVIDLGSIVLHRIAQVQGYTLSATSAAAPRKARKDYEKGISLENKSAWASAQKKFQSAVDVYPKYAAAWVELGKMQMKQDADSDAKQSFQKAVAADCKFLPPYRQLIALAGKEEKWAELADLTSQLLTLDPVSFPQYWFLNSAANFNLRKYDLAEKSARRGLETDVAHTWPRLELVLGLALARRHDDQGAVAHLRTYLRMAPGDPPAELAQNQLKRIEALQHPSAQANP